MPKMKPLPTATGIVSWANATTISPIVILSRKAAGFPICQEYP